MFAQFRHQYPQGSITADIIEKVDGMHTFRAVVRSGDVILSTAYATDHNFEQAEERAVEKALARVGLESTYDHNYAPLLSQVTRETDSMNAISDGNARSLVNRKPQLQAATTLIPEERRHQNSSSSQTYGNAINGEILKEIPAPSTARTHQETIAPETISHHATGENFSYQSVPEPVTPEPLPLNSPEPHPTSEPLDLSEAITQIDVEMQRLNWSQEDGRDYLIRTFNKKSRQRLTPRELENFLNYLKSLPNPISHSFTSEPEDIF
ncbi:MAG: hypothetical protein ACK456_07285 [Pseudanabaenaceae cyanobacterium]|jgi:hypothetical protein